MPSYLTTFRVEVKVPTVVVVGSPDPEARRRPTAVTPKGLSQHL